MDTKANKKCWKIKQKNPTELQVGIPLYIYITIYTKHTVSEQKKVEKHVTAQIR